MPPKDYVPDWASDFWGTLLAQDGMRNRAGARYTAVRETPVENYNVGDVIVGEIVEERMELI